MAAKKKAVKKKAVKKNLPKNRLTGPARILPGNNRTLDQWVSNMSLWGHWVAEDIRRIENFLKSGSRGQFKPRQKPRKYP